MAKPIFTIGLPTELLTPNFTLHRAQETFSVLFTDYNVLVYPLHAQEFKFNAFYEKDFQDVKFKDLKKTVLKMMEAPDEIPAVTKEKAEMPEGRIPIGCKDCGHNWTQPSKEGKFNTPCDCKIPFDLSATTVEGGMAGVKISWPKVKA